MFPISRGSPAAGTAAALAGNGDVRQVDAAEIRQKTL